MLQRAPLRNVLYHDATSYTDTQRPNDIVSILSYTHSYRTTILSQDR